MFDFDATLPIMALQFLLLTYLLNLVFYKPLTKALDERDAYVRDNEVDARDRLSKAEQIVTEYEKQIAVARRESQSILDKAQADAKDITAQKTAEAQQQVQSEREKAAQEIQQQKEAAMQSLETQVDTLSHQILAKLLGADLVRP